VNFELTPEQKGIRALARDFAVSEVAPVIRHFDETHEFPHEILARLGKTGLLGALVPEEYGGAALDYVSYALAVEELNRVDASVGNTLWAHNSLCTNHNALIGSTEQKARNRPGSPGARRWRLGADGGRFRPDAAAMKARAGEGSSCSTGPRPSSPLRG
jgi:alkylation response protein AidB-like acyl-CoA dehydrogenase